MIGVIFRNEQRAAVAEFFELFKTPWEPWHSQGSYQVLLVAADEPLPTTLPRLTVVFGARQRPDDSGLGIECAVAQQGNKLETDDGVLPLYGQVGTLRAGADFPGCAQGADGALALRREAAGRVLLRAGYDLFDEVRLLLGQGQPLENAACPALDLHVALLRTWLIGAGVSFVEIPPVPAGFQFAVALTHDIDFVGIRRHKFDHTMFGFLYRATAGSVLEFLRGARSLGQLGRNLVAALKLPLVWLGLARDFWMQFDAYREIERGLSATYFFIPFRGRAGEKVNAAHAGRRAGPYELDEVASLMRELVAEGCEVGVHGIDAWHDAAKGREELRRVAAIKGDERMGIRMHWLLQDENTPRVLEAAGYSYDSTSGYNDAVGYRAGTHQVFRPIGNSTLLEMPMHIQDGALFYGSKLGLSDAQALRACQGILANARKFGGVLTVLWHDRSLGPERHWGDFYVRLIADLRTQQVWFANARAIVDWFRARRAVVFSSSPAEGCELTQGGTANLPPLVVREHRAGSSPRDLPWDGATPFHFNAKL
jgi:hypothetical protein